MKVLQKKEIGLNDKNGTPIREGDIVEFYYDAEYGHGDSKSGYTRMVDIVEWRVDNLGKEGWAFTDPDYGSGAHASHHNEHCEVIGNIHETAY